MCFVNLEKAFDRVPSKVLEWAMMKEMNTRTICSISDEYV